MYPVFYLNLNQYFAVFFQGHLVSLYDVNNTELIWLMENWLIFLIEKYVKLLLGFETKMDGFKGDIEAFL